MLGNNSCGIHSLLSGNHGLGVRTSDNTHSAGSLTYDGERMRVGETSARRVGTDHSWWRAGKDLSDSCETCATDMRIDPLTTPKLPRRVSGYNLTDLLPENGFHVARALVGSEGTLCRSWKRRCTWCPTRIVARSLVLGYPDVYSAADHILEILQSEPDRPGGDGSAADCWIEESQARTGESSVVPPPGKVACWLSLAANRQRKRVTRTLLHGGD